MHVPPLRANLFLSCKPPSSCMSLPLRANLFLSCKPPTCMSRLHACPSPSCKPLPFMQASYAHVSRYMVLAFLHWLSSGLSNQEATKRPRLTNDSGSDIRQYPMLMPHKSSLAIITYTTQRLFGEKYPIRVYCQELLSNKANSLLLLRASTSRASDEHINVKACPPPAPPSKSTGLVCLELRCIHFCVT